MLCDKFVDKGIFSLSHQIFPVLPEFSIVDQQLVARRQATALGLTRYSTSQTKIECRAAIGAWLQIGGQGSARHKPSPMKESSLSVGGRCCRSSFILAGFVTGGFGITATPERRFFTRWTHQAVMTLLTSVTYCTR